MTKIPLGIQAIRETRDDLSSTSSKLPDFEFIVVIQSVKGILESFFHY